jgi:hypothetical protein
MTFHSQQLLFVYFRIQPKMTIKRTPEGVGGLPTLEQPKVRLHQQSPSRAGIR